MAEGASMKATGTDRLHLWDVTQGIYLVFFVNEMNPAALRKDTSTCDATLHLKQISNIQA